jgi:branched-chain amino acid transport system substrate-binding protein
MHKLALAAGLAVGLATLPMLARAQPQAQAQAPIRIGFISSFSGPEGVIGQDQKDGWNLALAEMGDKMGGRPVTMIWGDDEVKADIGRQVADKMIESDHVQLLTGINFSNVLLAVVKPALDAGIPYISINAAPSQLAGKGCKPLFFAPSHQNDALFESVGEYMQKKGIPSVYMLAPNYPAGRDMLNGFRRFYHGDIKAEVYTTLPTFDFSTQIAEIRQKKPAAVLFFLPGGMTVNFVKQYVAAGLKDIPLYTGPGSVDALTLPALGASANGVTVITNWTEGLSDNAKSQHFADTFEAKYGRIPSAYAAVAYDVANLLNASLTDIGGKIEDTAALRKAIDTVKFDSVRDGFSFNTNQFPIQDMYETVVGQDAKGRWTGLYKGVAVEKKHDSYAQDCHLPPY